VFGDTWAQNKAMIGLARRAGYAKYTKEFNRLIWKLASPRWAFDDATFERTAAAFENPDFVAITLHNYR
jgi:hypothetical protein